MSTPLSTDAVSRPANGPAADGDVATVSMKTANVLAMALTPVALVPLVAHAALHGRPSMPGPGAILLGILVYVASVVAHEALHGAGFLLGGARRADIRFGIDRATLSPFAGCRVPIPASRYRLAVALPALVLGPLPLAAGLATGSFALTLYGTAMLHAATGDGCALWAMRRVPGHARVVDHTSRVGCHVMAD